MKKVISSLSIIGLVSFMYVLFSSAVMAEPYGWSPNVDNSWGGTPKCTESGPKPPILYQPNHPVLPKAKGKGQIRLQWTKVPEASNYSVFYGLSPKNYIYSAPDIGDTDNFTVGYLANKTYYFAVSAKKGCASSGPSNEWGGRPGVGGYYVAAAPGFTAVRRTAPKTVAQKPGSAIAYVPPVQIEKPQPEVKGTSDVVTVSKSQVRNDREVVQQPKALPTTPIYPTPTPKPKSLWQSILGIFGFR